MKDFIVLMAVLLILLPFPLQYALEEYNHHQKSEIQAYVNSAKEQAKQLGYFSDAIISQLTENISNNFNINKAEIMIDVTITPKYRTNEFDERELIHYRVDVPIKKIIAVPSIWGISNSENSAVYTIEGFATSEALMP